MKNNAGIDYSMGNANRDKDTGIHYGVISIHEVTQAWCEDSEPGTIYACPECGTQIYDIDYEDNTMTCPSCGITSDTEEWYQDSGIFYYEDGSYIAEQLQDDTDIFITKSPYYTLCSFCSPCAPGAGYIMDQNENGIKAYCFGKEWFDDNKAPYKVFSVKTGREVK